MDSISLILHDVQQRTNDRQAEVLHTLITKIGFRKKNCNSATCYKHTTLLDSYTEAAKEAHRIKKRLESYEYRGDGILNHRDLYILHNKAEHAYGSFKALFHSTACTCLFGNI